MSSGANAHFDELLEVRKAQWEYKLLLIEKDWEEGIGGAGEIIKGAPYQWLIDFYLPTRRRIKPVWRGETLHKNLLAGTHSHTQHIDRE